uniref:Protein-tyrosine-phosphatase n=1 Tax=Roseihalotalea indica TaxID=2867963 RepID=A0AA49JEY6_9BACT|nr:protein-tyrosine-phosphatase [Tunicatimonas sp. TK19036]
MKTIRCTLFIFIVTLLCNDAIATENPRFTRKLQQYVESAANEFEQISAERKEALQTLGDYIARQRQEVGQAQVLFICTQNSRRSHLGQIWLQTAAQYYGLDGIRVYSGGLEASTFNERAADALDRAGFQINAAQQQSGNPRYVISPGNGYPTSIHYSKAYQDTQNPSIAFAAVMVCSEADQSCPVVPGADVRVPLPYEDPRYYDGTPSEAQKYDETTREIARQMLYLADYVKNTAIQQMEAKK